jgi:phosphate transport system permease protein
MATPARAVAARPRVRTAPGDRVFAGAAKGAGIAILVMLAGVAVFLLVEAWPAITAPAREIPGGRGLVAYIAPLAFGTVLAAVLAALIAVPFAVAIALFVTHYAPRRIAPALGYLIDLLAAVPSVVYGLWGVSVLAPASRDVTRWLAANLGFLPFFEGPASATGRTMLVAGIVLASRLSPARCSPRRRAATRRPRWRWAPRAGR